MNGRVLLVCPDLHQNDLLMAELTDSGIDATPAFSADEALGLLADRNYDAIILAEDIEDGMVGLLRWMSKRHRGIVVTLPERRDDPVDEVIAEQAEAGVVARLVATLSAAHRPPP